MSDRNAAAFFAWFLLLVAIVGVVVAQQVRPHKPPEAAPEQKSQPGHMEKDGATQEQLALDLQNRLVLGAVETVGRDSADPSVWLKEPQSGSAPQRVYFLILAGELAGAKEVKRLHDEAAPEQAKKDADPKWAELAEVIDRLYEDYAAQRYDHPWLSETTRAKLESLGWSGKIALAPAGGPNADERAALLESAQRAFVVCVSVFAAVGFFFILGLFAWFFLPMLIAYGKSRFGLPRDVPHHGVYVETFTLWVILYGVLSAIFVLLAPPEHRLLMSALGMLLSLVVLGWPVLRGVPWRRVRHDIGLTWGRRPFLEPFFGIVIYSMTLYLVIFGALFAYGLFVLDHYLSQGGAGGSPQDLRPNPIVEYMTNMDTWMWVQVFFAASVVAPVVEETMFRGVLYRHLRGTGRWMGTVLSVVVSALLVSFIFAIIHPQTLYAVPVLMALAFGFTLAREWRGSLVAPMVAHGLHNGLIILVVSQLMAN